MDNIRVCFVLGVKSWLRYNITVIKWSECVYESSHELFDGVVFGLEQVDYAIGLFFAAAIEYIARYVRGEYSLARFDSLRFGQAPSQRL